MARGLTAEDRNLNVATALIEPLVEAYDLYYDAMRQWVEAVAPEDRDELENQMARLGTTNCGWDSYRVAQDIRTENRWARHHLTTPSSSPPPTPEQ